MMRSRAVREGAVGLLILGGVLGFAGLFIWIYNLRLGVRGYNFTILLETVSGLGEGANVRLRGVNIGRVARVDPGPEQVRVEAEIRGLTQIPVNSTFITSQTGLVGETILEIYPISGEGIGPEAGTALENCNPELIVCDGAEVQGVSGVDYADLISSVDELTERINNDEFFNNLNKTLEGVTEATLAVAELSETLDTSLSQLNTEELDLAEFTSAAQAIRGTAEALSATGTEINSLISENRARLTSSLQSVEQVAQDLQSISSSLEPLFTDASLQAQLRQILEETVTASQSAATTMENLEQLSAQLNDPGTLATLRQTLDSARVTFENAEKISADLDELTGDPQFRENLRKLVDGLSGLVSSAPLSSPSTAPASSKRENFEFPIQTVATESTPMPQ
jgi:phospholipid/cholesterol/gamma-HCH transport system substrate-binding protein